MRHERSIQLIPDDLSRIDAAALHDLKAVTAEALGQHDVLSARCTLCKHEGRIDRQALTRRWTGVSLMQLEHHLVCRHCRSKGNSKFLVSRLPRD